VSLREVDMSYDVSRTEDAANSEPKITNRAKAKETREPGVEGVWRGPDDICFARASVSSLFLLSPSKGSSMFKD
jgi:hypothetical protein